MSGPARQRVVLVKLGGSLITEKGSEARARPEVIEGLARQLAEARGEIDGCLAVGHGAGSFGHPPAARHGLGQGVETDDARRGLSLTQRRAAALHEIVTAHLRAAGLPTFSIVPSSAAVASAGELYEFALEPVALALREELVPVLYGDVVLDRRRGVAIASTESVFVEVARRLDRYGWTVGRVLWLGDTEGVYDEEGQVIPEIRPGAGVEVPSVGGSATTDVTGGMAHRVEAAVRLARRGIPSWIGTASRGRLRRVLAGEAVTGTRVAPGD